ncbi:MAG: Holliday junction branch migration protein RuvA [Pseudomonadales bacterium]
MIGLLRGVVLAVDDMTVLLAVGGVGYEVEVSAAALALAMPRLASVTAAAPVEETTLYTHFVVREDAQQLFGFATRAERDLFRALIRISGVGPKLALNVISGISLADLAAAVEGREPGLLTRIPGIGRKTAERLIVELAGKLPDAAVLAGARRGSTGSRVAVEAEQALVALGYRPAEAAQAVAQAEEEGAGEVSRTTEMLVRAALRNLARASERS